MKNAVHFYMTEYPDQGMWVGLDTINSWDDVRNVLTAANTVLPREGHILAREADFLAAPFLNPCGQFDLSGFIACRDANGSDEAKIAFLDCFGKWDAAEFEAKYLGQSAYDSSFVMTYIAEIGWADGTPAAVLEFIDWEKVVANFMRTRFTSFQGHYFTR